MLKHVCWSLALLIGAVAYTSVGFAEEKKAAAPSTQPINTMCAVEKAEKIDPAVTTEYKGKVIGFCCDHCIPMFKKDPEKYMKDLK